MPTVPPPDFHFHSFDRRKNRGLSWQVGEVSSAGGNLLGTYELWDRRTVGPRVIVPPQARRAYGLKPRVGRNGKRPTLGMRGVTIEPQSGSGLDGGGNGDWGATPLGLNRFAGRWGSG
jgi:hypothetical protein